MCFFNCRMRRTSGINFLLFLWPSTSAWIQKLLLTPMACGPFSIIRLQTSLNRRYFYISYTWLYSLGIFPLLSTAPLGSRQIGSARMQGICHCNCVPVLWAASALQSRRQRCLEVGGIINMEVLSCHLSLLIQCYS